MDYFTGANAIWTVMMVGAIVAMGMVLGKGFKIMIDDAMK